MLMEILWKKSYSFNFIVATYILRLLNKFLILKYLLLEYIKEFYCLKIPSTPLFSDQIAVFHYAYQQTSDRKISELNLDY